MFTIYIVRFGMFPAVLSVIANVTKRNCKEVFTREMCSSTAT